MFLIRKGQKNKPIESTSKCSMGWFFGFKLHLICNERGELLNFMVTPGDVNDRKPLENKRFFADVLLVRWYWYEDNGTL